MKKWHMEGIVGLSGNHHQKLIIPDLRRIDTVLKHKRVTSRKDPYITQVLRSGVGLLLKYF